MDLEKQYGIILTLWYNLKKKNIFFAGLDCVLKQPLGNETFQVTSEMTRKQQRCKSKKE